MPPRCQVIDSHGLTILHSQMTVQSNAIAFCFQNAVPFYQRDNIWLTRYQKLLSELYHSIGPHVISR
jgi:hypothetical protein